MQVQRRRRMLGVNWHALWGGLLLLTVSVPFQAQEAADPEKPWPVTFPAYERLPDGDAEDLAAMYYAAREVPGVQGLAAVHRRGLLDVVTQRYKNRLVDRGAGSSAAVLEHLERLSRSPLALERPMVMAQACAQYGVDGGACAPHEQYVRRAALLEEMLVVGRLTLAELETELVGEPRASLRARQLMR